MAVKLKLEIQRKRQAVTNPEPKLFSFNQAFYGE